MTRQMGSLSQWFELSELCISFLRMSKLDLYTTRTLELEVYLSKYIKRKQEENKNMSKK